MADRPHLRALADALGVVDGYRRGDGAWCATTDETRVALLAAMRVDASSERSAAAARRDFERIRAQSLIDPVRVVRRGDANENVLPFRSGDGGPVRWAVEIVSDTGVRLQREGRSRARARLPADVDDGYHRVLLEIEAQDGHTRRAEQMLVRAPQSCVGVAECVRGGRGFGVLANLYSVRNGRSDFGDLRALRALVRWAGSAGADFVGVNPLSAIRAGGYEVSPYSPTTRLFRSELYLDLAAVPEWGDCEAARQVAAVVQASDGIDYEKVRDRKLAALRHLYRTFAAAHGAGGTGRGKAFTEYRQKLGSWLEGFATFRALDEHFGTARGGTHGWREWPQGYRRADSRATRRFARDHADEIAFHGWIQFEIDRQLGRVAELARRSGLALGVYQDLPIGSVPSGCEEWLLGEQFCDGATIGAPPDAFFAGGQDWGLAPLDPHALRRNGFAYWIALLRAAFAHAGALRIDHIMGLARQYWVPRGRSARDGAYVRMPADELFGILALESRRAGAVVIGEDLGTVPAEIPPLLERWGVLGSRVLYFERTSAGGFRSPRTYPARCFVSANTHDLATLEGYAAGRDIDLNERAGVLDGERATAARRARGREIRALRRAVGASARTRLLRPVYEHLAAGRAALVGVALDDLGGEVDPVNLPGVSGDVYPSWRRRMRRSVSAIAADPAVQRTLAAVRRQRRAKVPSPSRRR